MRESRVLGIPRGRLNLDRADRITQGSVFPERSTYIDHEIVLQFGYVLFLYEHESNTNLSYDVPTGSKKKVLPRRELNPGLMSESHIS